MAERRVESFANRFLVTATFYDRLIKLTTGARLESLTAIFRIFLRLFRKPVLQTCKVFEFPCAVAYAFRLHTQAV